MANAVTNLTASERFFFDNAGYWNSKEGESRIAGHVRCAKALARASQEGFDLGWELTFDYDQDASYDEKATRYVAILRDEEGNVLETLGNVDDDGSEYSRVLFAELASEALARLEPANA